MFTQPRHLDDKMAPWRSTLNIRHQTSFKLWGQQWVNCQKGSYCNTRLTVGTLFSIVLHANVVCARCPSRRDNTLWHCSLWCSTAWLWQDTVCYLLALCGNVKANDSLGYCRANNMKIFRIKHTTISTTRLRVTSMQYSHSCIQQSNNDNIPSTRITLSLHPDSF